MNYCVHRAGHGFLTLSGPFCYPAWSSETAQRFTYGQAHAWAAAYGGDVVPA